MNTNDILTDKHIEQIKEINLSKDSSSQYNSQKWLKLNTDYQPLISDFLDAKISREVIINSYSEYYNNNGCYIKAFLLSMIWGFGDSGYGTYRTNKYLSKKGNLINIKISLDYIKQNDLENAFKSLNKIKGLGISYISKILYFATKGVGNKDYALIFDIRVATSLIQLNTPKAILDIVEIYPSSKFKDYEKYNKLIHQMAKKHNIDADAIEIFLFNQLF